MTFIGRFAVISSLFVIPTAQAINWADDHAAYDFDDLSQLQESCKAFNREQLQTSGKGISCTLDRASFEKHFEDQLRIKKPSERDPTEPKAYCGMALMFMTRPAFKPASWSRICGKARPEFRKVVTTIECRYTDIEDVNHPPHMKLDQGKLIIPLGRPKNSMATFPSEEWVRTELMRLLPVYRHCMEAHGYRLY